MENKNPFIMKQPELGQKILELRKSQGLTQEELVEKCNINVRTIQRIEAGEVTPRSYTVKSILEALEVDSKSIFKSEETKDEIQFSSKEVNQLNISWITGIFFLVLSVIGIVAEFYFWDEKHGYEELLYRIPFNILSITVLIFFLKGYKVLAKHFEKSSLLNAVYAYLIIEVMISLLTTGTVFLNLEKSFIDMAVGIPIVILYGVAELVLGLGITKLKEDLGSFSNILGILKIVNGGLLISVLFSPIAMFLSIPIIILEIVFIYNLANNKKFSHS